MKWLALHIGGQRWGVYIVPRRSAKLVLEGERCNGVCDYDTCKIYISRGLSDQARDDALLHEILHALLHVTGAEAAYGGEPDADEAIVSALTPALHRLLIDLGFRFPRGMSG